MEIAETPEERRERLKTLAKARVQQLVGGEGIVPHIKRPENRLLTSTEAEQGMADLLGSGLTEFPIRERDVRVVRINEEKSPGKHQFICSVTVDGEMLDELLLCDFKKGETACRFEVPQALILEVGSTFVWGRTPYNALFKVIGTRPFIKFFAELTELSAERNRHRQFLLDRITAEAERFREILLRKYRQLAYLDEYDGWETAKFQEEARRFASKRLPDLVTSTVIDVVMHLVSGWAEEAGHTTADTIFNESMSSRDYEQFCADRFAAAGWAVHLTKPARSQGGDLICRAGGQRLVIKCKLSAYPIGSDVIAETIAAQEFEYAEFAAVVSNAPFTPEIIALATAVSVQLLHHDQIGSMVPP